MNGDRVHWLVKKDGRMEVLSKETNTVGLNISTKKVGSNWRNDVTLDYKFAEGLFEILMHWNSSFFNQCS